MSQDMGEQSSELFGGLQMPNYLELLRVAWRRKSLIALGLVVSVVLGSLFYVQATPIYKSDAQVLVVKKSSGDVVGDMGRNDRIEDYISTHKLLILSPLVVDRAIERGKLRTLKSFTKDQEDLTTAIIEKLNAARVGKDSPGNPNSVMKLEFRGKVASECGTVVNAVLASYKSVLDETYRNMTDETVALITQARDVLENDLAKKELVYREFREESPMIWKDDKAVNPRQDRLAMIESQRTALLLHRADLEDQLATIAKAQEAGRSEDELIALVSDLAARASEQSSNPESYATHNSATLLKGQLLPLVLEEQILRQDLGPNHPQVKSAREKVRKTHTFLALPPSVYSKPADADDKPGQNPSLNLADLYTDNLKQELERVKTAEQARADLFTAEHDAARELTSYELRDGELRSSLARTQLLYDGIVKRLQEASLVKDYGGFDARVISPAKIGKKVYPSGLIVLAGSLFLGCLGGGGLVYLAEVTDKRFRTPDEIRRRLGLPVVGHIPQFQPDEEARELAASTGGLDPMLFAHFQPRSAGAEAYRAVRTSLYFSTAGEGHTVIQVTSPNPGDGKSTVCANVAASIAQSGKRTLLIDADLRKPRQHRIFAVGSKVGLASVIAEEAELADAIQETKIRNLSILPCGPLPDDPSELLTSPKFHELLTLLREQYDYVIVDTAPLLAVTDPCVVAPRVDGVLLTVRISKDGRAQAERARDILATLDAKVLGVVVNGVETGARGYGYEYQYYSYEYAQDYQQKEDDTNEDVGQDSEQPEPEASLPR